jgi:lysophospholipase L1-like esterase
MRQMMFGGKYINMVKTVLILVWLLLVINTTSLQAAGHARQLQVKPDNSKLFYSGRFSNDFRFGWSGSAVSFAFKGQSARAVLKLMWGRKVALQVVVDGKPTKVIFVTSRQTHYPLVTSLPDGIHHLQIWQRTEGGFGELKFMGLELNSGATLLKVKPPERRLLFIGDSITCGYGNEAKTKPEGNTVENENSYLAYGALTARALNSDIMTICWSGKGVYRNCSLNNDKIDTLPQLFDRTLPGNKQLVWNHKNYRPQLIVINLGTNDAAQSGNKKAPLDEKLFLTTYETFIKYLQQLYPKAKIIIAIGPMQLKPLSEWLQQFASTRKNIYYLEFLGKVGEEYIAGHWHPSVKMHKIMAEQLTTKIKKIMNW